MANLVLPLALALLCAAAAGASSGCPACGADLAGHKIATVHPGEPAMMLFGIPTAEQCAQECKNNSPELLFFQHAKCTLNLIHTCTYPPPLLQQANLSAGGEGGSIHGRGAGGAVMRLQCTPRHLRDIGPRIGAFADPCSLCSVHLTALSPMAAGA